MAPKHAVRLFAAWAASLAILAAARAELPEGVAATVNGKAITAADVESAWKRTQFSREKLPPEQEKLYRAHVLRLLVDDALVSQFLDEQKTVADQAKVEQHIAEIGKQLAKSGKTLEQFLAESGATEQRMRDDISNIYRWIKHLEGLATESALKKYFEANKSAFDGSAVRASHILVKVKSDATAEEREASKRKIEELRGLVAGGLNFAEAARKHSDCPSKENGGDLDYFPRKGVMSEAFAAAAFDLQPGQLSGVVETEFGYHVLVVIDRKPGQPVKYEEAEGDVRDAFAADTRAAVIARMRKTAKIELPGQ